MRRGCRRRGVRKERGRSNSKPRAHPVTVLIGPITPKTLLKHKGVPDQGRDLGPSAFTRFCLFEADHHAIGAKRQLQPLAPRIQFHGDAIPVAQPQRPFSMIAQGPSFANCT